MSVSLIYLGAACNSENNTGQRYFSAADLEGMRIGVMMGYGADVSITNLGIFDIHRYQWSTDLPVALKAGNIDGFALERSEAELYISEIPDLVILPHIIGSEEYVAICSKENEILGREIDSAIGGIIDSSAYREMQDRWLSGNLDSAIMPEIPRGTGEKLVVAISTEYMPFEYFGEGGGRLGFDVEMILRIGAALGREIEFYETSYTSLFIAINSGYADVCISVIDDKPALREKYYVTRAYYDNVIVMVVQAGEERPAGFMEGIKRSVTNHLIVEKRYTYIVEGLVNTLIIAVLAAVFGTLLGALLCAMSRGKKRLLNKIAGLYVRIMQGMPIIVLLLFITYVVLAGSGMDPIAASALAFSLYFSAKASEIFRAGLDSVDMGQVEASIAMGLSGLQMYRLVLIPQAAILALPVYCADLVEMLKLTSVVGYVGVMDLTYALEVIRSRTYEAVFPMLLETLIYILLTTLLARVFRAVMLRIDPLKKDRRIRL